MQVKFAWSHWCDGNLNEGVWTPGSFCRFCRSDVRHVHEIQQYALLEVPTDAP